jgi:hypothetical protein
MSKSKPGASPKKRRFPEQRPAGRRRPLIAVAILAAIGIVAVMVPVRAETEVFETLMGRWLRLDGGYILEIRGVDPSGKIDALYLNPRPINIAKAEATRDGRLISVRIQFLRTLLSNRATATGSRFRRESSRLSNRAKTLADSLVRVG